ncbi:serpin family protein [Candidatus Absconditicoccus praedator]|uniref:serpin family protein n=1 Tax=Candidatus Absconditicoccus praedator TaxID=2735562 RepID=UPI001E3082F2|nr:serpin family protein [Candidatus Absconditicoccus praedator]UFX83350.1 serpin family protein [Candidatus Absconditicoccus praedator]
MGQKKILLSALVLLSIIFFTGCDEQVSSVEPKDSDSNGSDVSDSNASDLDFGEPEDIDISEIDTSVLDTKNFDFDIFYELIGEQVEKDENLFISPYSIHAAFLLAYMGADGETKEQMSEVLETKGVDINDVKKAYYAQKEKLQDYSTEGELSIANALFLDQGIPFRENYVKDGQRYFDAKVEDMPDIVDPINEWIEEQTNGKIEDMLGEPGEKIDPLVVAYLINAIYFKNDWETEFDSIRDMDFETPDGQKEVDMMYLEDDHRYVKEEEYQMVSKGYEDESFAFHAIMPKQETLQEFYEDFDREKFEEIKTQRRKGEIELYLPKFTFGSSLGLVEVMQDLGIKDAFDSSLANFDNMVDLEELGQNVYISDALHDTFIEVNKEGTEAAAATVIEIRAESAQPPSPVLKFDEPFMFIIEEEETGQILFMGQMMEPVIEE